MVLLISNQNRAVFTVRSFPMEPSDSLTAAAEPPPERRRVCISCSRPAAVCLCHTLPVRPIPTATQIVILHHPHEARHKLSTVPVLSKCLLNATTVVGRRLRPGLCPILDESTHAIYLFPPTHSSPAVNLSELHSDPPNQTRARSESSRPVLIVFDGTWKHAKEMVTASEGFLSRFATRVCLDCDEKVCGGTIHDSELILRKEPYGGCVSTMEAVARCLRVLEPNGAEVERALIDVLREMVRLQASFFLKPVNRRPELLKNGENGTEKSESEDEDSSV